MKKYMTIYRVSKDILYGNDALIKRFNDKQSNKAYSVKFLTEQKNSQLNISFFSIFKYYQYARDQHDKTRTISYMCKVQYV